MAGTSLSPSPLSSQVAISGDGSQVYDSELNKIKEDPERIQKQAPPLLGTWKPRKSPVNDRIRMDPGFFLATFFA